MKNKQESRSYIFNSFKAKKDLERNTLERFADWMTSVFGSTGFLLLNALFFAGWIYLNIESISPIKPFDPYPFGFLTMAVSLEAIFLSIIVLISQNRESKVADLREEVDLQITMIAEKEITKIMQMITLLLEKEKIDLSKDSELKKMLKPVKREKIEKKLESELKS